MPFVFKNTDQIRETEEQSWRNGPKEQLRPPAVHRGSVKRHKEQQRGKCENGNEDDAKYFATWVILVVYVRAKSFVLEPGDVPQGVNVESFIFLLLIILIVM